MPAITSDLRERARGCLVGAAIGDAFGMALEAAPMQPVTAQVREMRRGRLPAGHFTAHTGAILTVAEGLLEPEPVSIDELAARTQAPHRPGAAGSRGQARGFLGRLLRPEPSQQNAPAAAEVAASADPAVVARSLPVALATLDNHFACLAQARQLGEATHPHPDCVAGGAFVAAVLWHLVQGLAPRQAVRQSLQMCSDLSPVLEESIRWASTRMREKLANGEQVDEIIEAVVWGLLTTASFAEAVTRVCNLGGSASVAGTIVGAWAGAAYRHSGIPADWRAGVHGTWPARGGSTWREKDLVQLAERLLQA